ncbi:hypothetical protein ACFV0T_03830 [Streptomyces sp. NPDC059582]|uniref:hypothetical protein n=1 Tax=Streptomyces sp. NPDC059582 TaxID=3346875 RepID=UPI0036B4D78A
MSPVSRAARAVVAPPPYPVPGPRAGEAAAVQWLDGLVAAGRYVEDVYAAG